MTIYEDFSRHYKKAYKWSKIFTPHSFYGLSITTSPLEKLNDLLKAKVPRETNIPIIVDKVFKLYDDMVNKNVCCDKMKNMWIFGDKRLKELQSRLGSRVFARLLKYYVKGIEMRPKVLMDEDEEGYDDP